MDNLAKVVKEYNKYRAPEVEAQVLHVKEGKIVVKFGGSFCYTCGFYDYIDDLLIELRDAGINAEVKEVIECIPDGVIVVFEVKSENVGATLLK
ncbi:MAG: hypothetical protein QW701_01915 [Candidatus Nezhaarchaeales archaeon]